MKKILMTFCVMMALAIPLLAVDYAKASPQNVAVVALVRAQADITFTSVQGTTEVVLATESVKPVKAIYFSRYVEVRARTGPSKPMRC